MQKVQLGKKSTFRALIRLLKSELHIGGLDVSDESLTFLRMHKKTGAWERASVRLELGTFENGKLREPTKLRKSLRELHRSITHKKNEAIPVVLSISDENVYTQRFSLPPLARSEFKEAVKLNVQTLSPVDIAKVYFDWERVEKSEETSEADLQRGEQEILASFVGRDIIDSLITIFNEEFFFVTAIEQKATSLVRTIAQFEATFDPKKSYLLIMSTTDGVSFVIIKSASVYFGRFTSWEAIGQDLRNFVVRDFHQVNNFFSNKFHEKFECLYVASHNASDAISKILGENFSLPVRSVRVENKDLDESWFIALGASLRGMILRSHDTQISLAPDGTEKLYQQIRTSSFLTIWTEIFASVSFIILASFLGVFIFIHTYIGNTVSLVTASFNDPQVLAQYEFYTQEANIFNAQVTKALAVKSQQVTWSTFVAHVLDRAGSGVNIDRLYMQSRDMPVTLNGRATSEAVAQAFRNRLAQLPYLSDVDLPLASFQKVDATHISFRLTFTFKNLNF